MKNLRDKLEYRLVESGIRIGQYTKNRQVNSDLVDKIEGVVWIILRNLHENLNSYKPF